MIFFPVVLLIYFFIPKKIRYLWLLIASYYFYMSWNPKYALLIAFSTMITWLSGLLLGDRGGSKARKYIVVFSLVCNFSILIFFKYFDFSLQNLNHVFSIVGLTPVTRQFDIILPVGISFYTFQALSYTLDVYRGETPVEHNFFRYALFVSFFPQLVAGPIERSKNLLSQLQNIDKTKLWNYDRITSGSVLLLWGLFQKMVIADRAAILVDTVYKEYWIYGSVELVLASILFAIQIYCDFGAYSLIAIGAAKIMGFELMENFNVPYFSRSVREFWRRWHISLSTWFRDYLYIPLGGSRCTKWKHYRNVMVTFLLSGLWHGANWNFVAWGGLHGAYQIIEMEGKSFKEKIEKRWNIRTDCFSYRLGQAVITFLCVDLAWIFFRANGFTEALQIIFRIFTRWNPWVLFDQSLYQLGLTIAEVHILIIALIFLFLVDWNKYKTGETVDVFLAKQNIWFRWLAFLTAFFTILIYGIYGPGFNPAVFIYFQF